jgi:hypothetical protein
MPTSGQSGTNAKGPIENNFPATDVAQTLSLPRPDSSGRALERAQQASRGVGGALWARQARVLCYAAHAANVKLFLRGF